MFRKILLLTLACALAACGTVTRKSKNPDKAKKEKEQSKEKNMPDQNGDVAFQAFIGRLRKAVAARDMQMIASMMTPDFGYRWDTPPPDDNVFKYWDQNGIWPELTLVLNEHFVPNGNFMVAPPQFARNPDYHGFRAGVQTVNGGWRFAYFVTDKQQPQ